MPQHSRRVFLGRAAGAVWLAARERPPETPPSSRDLIAAPSNLGLRPPAPGREPGAWRAPEALLAAGLERRLSPRESRGLPRPRYDFDAQPGTRIRNGLTIRAFSLDLARDVSRSLDARAFPIIVGGDCSVLLGCLLGARQR